MIAVLSPRKKLKGNDFILPAMLCNVEALKTIAGDQRKRKVLSKETIHSPRNYNPYRPFYLDSAAENILCSVSAPQ